MKSAEIDPALVLQSDRQVLVLVTRHQELSATGGPHRFYQVLCDLQQAASSCAVLVIRPHALPMIPGLDSFQPPPRLQRLRRKVRRVAYSVYDRIRRFVEPRSTNITMRRNQDVHNQAHLDRFDYLLRRLLNKRAVAVATDDIAFFPYLAVGKANGLSTILFPENFECLAFQEASVQPVCGFAPALRDLSVELRLLAQADARLMISRVEAGFVAGLGISRTWVYPYRPVGVLLQWLFRIQGLRNTCEKHSGLCVALGTADHPPTRDSFLWLVGQIKRHGLPPDWSLVLMGKGTKEILSAYPDVPGVRALGPVSSEVLATYLSTAEVALVPYVRGFGALTRLSELSAAGIPMLASLGLSWSQDLPPGVSVLANEWSDWKDALASRRWSSPPVYAYRQWHESQPCPLREVLTTVTGGHFGS